MKTVVLLASVLVLVFAISIIPPSFAQFVDPIYMKYEGIDGEVTLQGHENEIQLNSFQFGVGRSISSSQGGDRQSSLPSVSEIVVTKQMDKASPKLLGEALGGIGKNVEIFFVLTGQDKVVTYAKYTLENCMVSSYSVSSGGDTPSESLSLNFSKITFEYTPLDEQGRPGTPERVSYDLANNQKI